MVVQRLLALGRVPGELGRYAARQPPRSDEAFIMKIRILLTFLCTVLLSTVCVPAIADDEPMEIFKPLLGTWSTRAVHRPSRIAKKAMTGTGEVTVKAILSNRFIRYEGYAPWPAPEQLDKADDDAKAAGNPSSPATLRLDYHVIMTYDERKQIYRRWAFQSDGVTAEATGVWNDDKKTMTWSAIRNNENVTFTGTTTIKEDGFEETLHGKRADGTVLVDVTTTQKKKKKKQ